MSNTKYSGLSILLILALMVSMLAVMVPATPAQAVVTTITINSPTTASRAIVKPGGIVPVGFTLNGTTGGTPSINFQVWNVPSGNIFNQSFTAAENFTDSQNITVDMSAPEGSYNLTLSRADNMTVTTVQTGAIYVDSTAPVVTLTTPNASTCWPGSSTQSIQWAASDAASTDNVTIYVDLSIDGGSTYPTSIIAGTSYAQGSQIYSYSVPSSNSSICKIRIKAIDRAGNESAYTTSPNFSIITTSPVATVVSPNGGEVWNGGSSQAVTGTITGSGTAVQYQIQLSTTGGGSSGSPIDLGTADSYAVLAASTVTNVVSAGTTVTGDLGLSPGTSVTGFPPGILVGTQHVADTAAAQAKLDLTTAYLDAAGRTPFSTIAGDTLGGLNLSPGVYRGGALGLTGTLTLTGDANAVWIFQAASTLTTASSSQVVLSGGALARNVFWQVGTSATLGTGSTFEGTIMALDSITLTNGVTLHGRALARNAAVTLDTNIVTRPASGTGGTFTTIQDWTSATLTGGVYVLNYPWTVSNNVRSSNSFIRVRARDCAGNIGMDISNSAFRIVDVTAPTVTVTAPATGATWYSPSTQTIGWTQSDNVAGSLTSYLYYTIDGGANWLMITSGSYAQGANTYSWTVPSSIGSTNCKIKVTATDAETPANTGTGYSGTFSINTCATTPSVTVCTPNGGESYTGGNVQSITWSAADAPDATVRMTYTIRLSNDGGATWTAMTPIVLTNQAQCSSCTCSYSWAVPNITTTTQAMIQITATDPCGNYAVDTSNAVFTITQNVCGVDTVNVTLTQGWNLMSLPENPTSTNIDSVLSSVIPSVTSVWLYDSVCPGTTASWYSYAPGAPSTLLTMEAGKAYWVNMASGGTLTFQGRKCPCPPASPTTITICRTGWNMIGFKSTIGKPVQSYLASLGTCGTAYLAPINGYASGAWTTVNCSDNMTAGKGYWVYINSTGQITPGCD